MAFIHHFPFPICFFSIPPFSLLHSVHPSPLSPYLPLSFFTIFLPSFFLSFSLLPLSHFHLRFTFPLLISSSSLFYSFPSLFNSVLPCPSFLQFPPFLMFLSFILPLYLFLSFLPSLLSSFLLFPSSFSPLPYFLLCHSFLPLIILLPHHFFLHLRFSFHPSLFISSLSLIPIHPSSTFIFSFLLLTFPQFLSSFSLYFPSFIPPLLISLPSFFSSFSTSLSFLSAITSFNLSFVPYFFASSLSLSVYFSPLLFNTN